MNSNNDILIYDAYKSALKFAKTHYENFPVVSRLIPKKIRKHIAIIYWFARTADDLADEGNEWEEVRLKNLDDFELSLKNLLNRNAKNGYEFALANTISENKLSQQHFFDLIKAFKQDVVKKRYENFNEVSDYCQHSANPVGRLILELFDIRDEKAFEYSDKICTALQLTNFLQDTVIDYNNGRIYLPVDEMQKFGVTEKLFEQKDICDNLKLLIKYNTDRIQKLFDEGKKLLPFLRGRLKYEIIWTVKGGEEILEQIRKNDYNVFTYRPELSKIRMAGLLRKSLFNI
ncbi:MAG: squalene synthase HpnC [Ignavibacteria bacterium]|nr:squalene synthase HpnC [Ignavibacteria bacterium]